MAILTISALSETETAPFSQQVELDGVLYGMLFQYNARDSRWFLDLSDESDALVVGSIPLVFNWPLLRKYQANPAVPQGMMMLITTDDPDQPAGNSDLGQRATIIYVEA